MKTLMTADVATPWMPTPPASVPNNPSIRMPISAGLHRFDPIRLEQMHDVELLSRVDTKYLIPVAQMPPLLMALSSHYRILDIGGKRLQPYRTLYFDTPDFELYHRHHAGGRNRYKVRSRAYLNSNLSFLEVKLKTNKKQTIKRRLQTPAFTTNFTAEAYTFLNDHFPFDPARLEPKLYNDYSRISLVSKTDQERLTLDLDLRFWYETNHAELPGIVIAELKQHPHALPSVFTKMMRDLHLRADSFSKYSIGASVLYPDLKQNRFKANHHRIAKLQERRAS
jgi:hypothetical protein